MIDTVTRPPPLRDQVYDRLRDALRQGALRPADRLTEVGLAEAMGVSRTPVREALGQLNRDGLIDTGPTGGFRVAAPDRADLEEIFEVRRLLEPHAAAQAAVRATAAGITALEAAMVEERAHLEDADIAAFADANSRFRAALFGMCGNRRLARTVRMYDDHAQVVRLLTLAERAVRAAVIDGQERILVAVQAGDGEAAAEAVERQLETAWQHLEQVAPDAATAYTADTAAAAGKKGSDREESA